MIATNYEDPSLRYYLGSRVIVGWFNPNVEQDLLLDPAVIIPRPGGKNRRALAHLASRPRAVESRALAAPLRDATGRRGRPGRPGHSRAAVAGRYVEPA